MQLLLLFQLERVALQGEHTTHNMQLGSPPVHFYEPVPHNVADTKLPHLYFIAWSRPGARCVPNALWRGAKLVMERYRLDARQLRL